jgi:hypothetical protein
MKVSNIDRVRRNDSWGILWLPFWQKAVSTRAHARRATVIPPASYKSLGVFPLARTREGRRLLREVVQGTVRDKQAVCVQLPQCC